MTDRGEVSTPDETPEPPTRVTYIGENGLTWVFVEEETPSPGADKGGEA